MRPAAQWLSFASPKESHQRKGDPARCVPALRCGQPAVLAPGGVRANSLRSNSARPFLRPALRSSAHPGGDPGGGDQTAAASQLRRAERSNGPCGCSAVRRPNPLWMRLGRAGCGVAGVPQDTPASSTDSPWLSECSASARSEFHGAPHNRAPQVAPQQSEGVADSRVAFLLGTFLWRSKEKYLACRGETRPATSKQPARI